MARLLWTQRQDIGPPGGIQWGMTYDAGRRCSLLLETEQLLDRVKAATWQWDGALWIQLADTGPQVQNPALAFDRGRQRVVAANMNQTWEWDGTSWTQVADAGGGVFVRLAYDTARARTVSVASGKQSLETWEWDGTSWTQVADSGPPVRDVFDVAYDDERKVLVLFGGEAGTRDFGDTWGWQGEVWEQLADMGPAPRSAHRMVYDTDRARIVLFGGGPRKADAQGAFNRMLGDTWEWDGARWSQLQDMGPPARGYVAIAYDHDRQRVVLFGGLSNDPPSHEFGDTWELGDYA